MGDDRVAELEARCLDLERELAKAARILDAVSSDARLNTKLDLVFLLSQLAQVLADKSTGKL